MLSCAISFVLGVLAAFGLTIAIVTVPLTAFAAMICQSLAQSRARTVQPNAKSVACQAEVACHALSVLFVEVDASDQFRIRRAQFGYQPAMAGA